MNGSIKQRINQYYPISNVLDSHLLTIDHEMHFDNGIQINPNHSIKIKFEIINLFHINLFLQFNII